MNFLIILVFITVCSLRAEKKCDPKENLCCFNDICTQVENDGEILCFCEGPKSKHLAGYFKQMGEYCKDEGTNSELKCCIECCKDKCRK